MSWLFSSVLNMSMTGSIIILLVIFVRFLLKRSPKIFSYILWSVVLFRLLCPVTLSAPVSVLEFFKLETNAMTETVGYVTFLPEQLNSDADIVTNPVPMNGNPIADMTQTEVNISQTARNSVTNVMDVLAYIWVAGVLIMMLYSIIQYAMLQHRLVGSLQYRDNVYLTDHLENAFVLGILRPRIYIPSRVTDKERQLILAHENHHIQRFDHVIRLLAYTALCIHWFNPLVWVAFILSGKDMEMSCDEAVVKKLGIKVRGDYAQALLRLASHKKRISGMPLAFGEGDTKSRVLNMARWRKPKLWVSLTCLMICMAVLAACAVNPRKEESLEEMTQTFGPASVGVGNLYFTLPEGFSIEMRESEVQPEGEMFLHEHVIRKNEEIVGGVYKLQYPDSNWADYWTWVEDLNVPENVPEERLMMYLEPRKQFLGYDYSMAAFYGKEGIEETVHYFFNGDTFVYDLWLDMELLSESERNQIMDSVEYQKTSWDGTLRLELPEGYDFSRDMQGNLIFTDGLNKVGGRRTFKVPEGFQQNEYFSQEFMMALGIPEAADETLGYSGGGSQYGLGAEGFGIEYFSDVPPGVQRDVHTYHQFFVMNDGVTIYDIWFDLLFVDHSVKDAIRGSVEIPEIGKLHSGTQQEDVMPTIPASALSQPFELLELPSGFQYDILGQNCVLIINSQYVVGGIDVFDIPEGIYDPDDKAFIWLEEMGLPDFEDPTLCYMGGMTSGDSGWLAEFASDVPDGTPRTVHRRHIYRVVGNQLCDIWLDMMLLSHEEAANITSAIRFADQPIPDGQSTEKTPEDIAFEKTLAIMNAVSEGSCHIVEIQKNEGYEGPAGYEMNYWYHEGDFLYTNLVLTAGENVNEAGVYYNRFAMLVVGDEYFNNVSQQGESGEIAWVPAEPIDPPVPWLGNRIWNRSFATYIDTLTDENGTCYMFRYDKPYADVTGYDPHYFVNFNFDSLGNFLNVRLQVNLFRDNEFSITEAIVSMDPDVVRAEIQKEYTRITG